MANYCLPPKQIDTFKRALKSGEINPAKLAEMSSEARRATLAQYVGDTHAKEVNSLFESKLLLKNQKAGFINWAQNVAGLKPKARRDIIAKIEKLQNVLDPADKKAFMSDLAEQKLGIGVSQEEAQTIANLSKKVSQAQEKMNPETRTFPTEEARLAYGRAAVDMTDYVNKLKAKTHNVSLSDLKSNPFNAGGKIIMHITGNAKAISASMDNSAIGRQGLKTLWTHPLIWQKNARQSFVNIVKTFGGKEVMREVMADIVSRPSYETMMRAKLAVGNLEEAFPTTLPEKIPIAGRAYKASEVAYTAFLQKTRADLFDHYMKIAEKTGVDTSSPKELKSIGAFVNSLTGRGSVGKLEPVANVINNVFFSPRFVASNIQTLTHVVSGAGGSNFVRKQAAINLVKIIGGTASVLATANAVSPGSVELDPRSSDFGKIRVGDTRFDVSGGSGSIITLAARLLTMSSKSSTTGKITSLNSGQYGSATGLDVLTQFAENKVSPAAGVLVDLLKGQDFNGNKPTVIGEIKNSFTPMGAQTAMEAASNKNGANVLLTTILDGLGISANTYSAQGGGNVSTWSKSTGKEITAFKNKVSPSTFKSAAKQYDDKYNTWITNVQQKSDYKKMNATQQGDLITKEKAKIQADIFKQNGFKYKRAKASKANSNLLQ